VKIKVIYRNMLNNCIRIAYKQTKPFTI